MVCDWLSQALGEWKWSMAVLPLILLTLAPSTEAKYDFQVYRANQYDIQKEQYGSRSSVMSYEGDVLNRPLTLSLHMYFGRSHGWCNSNRKKDRFD